MQTQFRFTKAEIDKLPRPLDGQRVEYRDDELPELRLRASASNKTFYFYGRCAAAGTNIRLKIGRYGIVSPEEARRQAKVIAGDCARGENPREKARRPKDQLTFDGLFQSYMAQHATIRKVTAEEDQAKYRRHVASALGRAPITRIALRDVALLHSKLTREAGPTTANRIHSLILGVFNWGIRHGLVSSNPAKGIKRNREMSRERFVREDEMPHFLRAARDEQIPSVGDLFQICLFTGQRIGNVLSMRWGEVNFDAAIWTIPRTKNGRPLVVALIPQALEVLRRRLDCRESDFVFPSHGQRGHLVEPKKGWRRVTARAECYRLIAALCDSGAMPAMDRQGWDEQAGAKPLATRTLLREMASSTNLPVGGYRTDDLRIHDLRRTLGSWLAMNGASQWVIGKVLGHQSPQSSAPYARVGTESQRQWVNSTVTAMLGSSRG